MPEQLTYMLVIYHLTLGKSNLLHQRTETKPNHKYLTCTVYLNGVDYFESIMKSLSMNS